MRELMYRPSWQGLRVSFLSENRTDGGWTTYEGTQANLKELDYYVIGEEQFSDYKLEAASMGWSGNVELSVRLYRAINCLNAVRMGYSGQSLQDSQQDQSVMTLRNAFRTMQTLGYKQDLALAETRWDWRVIEKEAKWYWDNRPDVFESVEGNLIKRYGFAMKSQSDVSKTRRELVTFLEILRLAKLSE